MKLTQRILRPVLNFLVKRYFPNRAFFGDDYLTAFDADVELKEKWGSVEMACAMLITSRLRGMGATSATFEATDVEDNGVSVGSWRMSVEKIDPQ